MRLNCAGPDHHDALRGTKQTFTLAAAHTSDTAAGLIITTRVRMAEQLPEGNRFFTVYLSYRTQCGYADLRRDQTGQTQFTDSGDIGFSPEPSASRRGAVIIRRSGYFAWERPFVKHTLIWSSQLSMWTR